MPTQDRFDNILEPYQAVRMTLLTTLRRHWLLIVLVLLGLCLRLWHIGYGLPQLYLEDENFFVDPALRVAAGNPNPDWFGAPGQPLIYSLGAVFAVVNVGVNIVHQTQLSVYDNYHADLVPFQMAGRALCAVIGALAIVFAYAIGAYWNRRAALWAAALVSTNYYLIFASHVIRPDIPQITALLGAVWAFLFITKHPTRWSGYIWLGIAMGLAINSKYPSLFLVVPVVLYIFCTRRIQWTRRRQWLTAIGSTLLTSFVTGPFLYLTPWRTFQDIRIEARPAHSGHDGYWLPSNLHWYVTDVLSFEIGSLLYGLALVVCLVTILMAVRRHRHSPAQRSLLIIVIALSSYLFFLSALALHWERWVMPVTTLLLIVAGVGIDWLQTHFVGRRWLIGIVLFALLIAPSVRLVRLMTGLSHPPTLAIARQWVIENIDPQDARIAEEYLGPPLPDSYHAHVLGNLASEDFRWYEQQGIDTIITTEQNMGQVMRTIIPRLSPDYDRNFKHHQPAYRQILESSRLIHTVYPYQQYSLDDLLYAHDWQIFKTMQLDIALGYWIHIYEFDPR